MASQQPANIGAGTNVPAQNDASGFTGPDPSGTTQSGAGQASGGVPDLTGEQGGATGPGSASDTGKSSGGVLHKVKQAFATHDEDGNPKKTE